MKRQNQFDRTDRDITNAVFALLDRKPFEKITVQDILDEAMINRSTFYQHFTDKYAVLEKTQERYVREITQKLDAIIENGAVDYDQIGRVLAAYMAEHRSKMKRLLAIRSENLDLEKQLRELFAHYIRQSSPTLTALEGEMLAGLIVQFLLYFLDNNMDAKEFAPTFLETYLHMSVFFFRLAKVPDADKKLLTFIGSLYQSVADHATDHATANDDPPGTDKRRSCSDSGLQSRECPH